MDNFSGFTPVAQLQNPPDDANTLTVSDWSAQMDTPDEIKWRRAQEALPFSERTFDFEAWASEKAQARRKIDAAMNELDVAEFLCHADMIPALQSGNPEAVGHIALRLYNAWLDECAEMKADAS